jgi:type 1 fimbria pilin
MKHVIRAAAIAAAFASTPALANESADLSITGAFVPAACQVSLSDGGRMSFGNVSMLTFNETGYTRVGTRQVTLNLACTGGGAAPVAHRR